MSNYENRVLFTCVGSTDPVRGFRDGGMLHIIRYYEPKKVYIFLSKEMLKFHEQDNRFEIAIEKLCKDKNLHIERKYIKSDIEDVSDFDSFAPLFDKYMLQIQEENPRCEILLNLSSGSPQMKTTMCLIALSTKYPNTTAIQVKTPERSSNKTDSNTKNYDLLEIELNEDNVEPINRCSEPKIFSVKYAMAKEQVLAFLNSYNYEAARLIIENNNLDRNGIIIPLLNHLIYRSNLKHKEAIQAIRNIDIDFEFYPIKDTSAVKITEYYLILKNLQKTNRLTDMILRLNPLIVTLQKEFLLNQFSFNCHDIMQQKNNRIEVKRELIEKRYPKILNYLDEFYRPMFNDSYLNINLQNHIIRYLNSFNSKDEIIKHVDFFAKCEELNSAHRNLAAHELYAISEQDIKKVTNLSSADIVKRLEKIIKLVFGNRCKPEIFNIYDDINELIIKQL